MRPFRYLAWNDDLHGGSLSTFENLFNLFQQLLLITAGDVQEALEWLTELDRRHGLSDDEMGVGDFVEELKNRGYIEPDPTEVWKLTPSSERGLRRRSLEEIFRQIEKGESGSHQVSDSGTGSERMPETRPWQFGDDVHTLDVTGTLSNAFRRGGADELSLTEDDFEVYETDHQTGMATVLMIDVSHSMVLYGEDRITPARMTAMALSELIMTRYPGDTLDIVAFGDRAWEVTVRDLPYLNVGPFHTNTRDGLQRARAILHRRRHRNKQIVMITDGKPSAQFESNGRLYKNPFGLDRRIINKVLDEAVVCRREGITITTFMVARDPYLQQFVRDLTAANKGRAYYASLNRLGEYLFEDYVRNRRKSLR
ncbi:MAG TPA: VWA domain-containing protein [Rhodothermales bacterium]|nr:VWA domain-containing protein [Rhodothermales bacterium]